MLVASWSLSGSAHVHPTVRRVEGRGEGGDMLGASWSLSGSAHVHTTVRRVEGGGWGRVDHGRRLPT